MLQKIYVSQLPHINMERTVFVDLKAPRPDAVRNIHQSHAQQLIIVVARPVEHNAGTRKCGDVAIRIRCSLGIEIGNTYPIAMKKYSINLYSSQIRTQQFFFQVDFGIRIMLKDAHKQPMILSRIMLVFFTVRRCCDKLLVL